MKITLYGASSDSIDQAYVDFVYAVGLEMAQRGHTLIFGGGNTGLMGAAARGITDGGGKAIGIMPGYMEDYEETFPFCSEILRTENMSDRKREMELRADAFLIVPGGIGTLDELFEIVTLKKLDRMPKPMVLCNILHFWDKMLAFLQEADRRGFISGGKTTDLLIADTPADVLEALEHPEDPRWESVI